MTDPTYRLLSLLVALTAFAGRASVRAETIETLDPKTRLDWFLGDETQHKALLPAIAQLDSKEFSEREAASARLSALPTLPAFLRTLAKEDKRPEARSRLEEINKLYPLKKEVENLNAILDEIAKDETQGTLETIIEILKLDIWLPSMKSLQNAGRATVTPADLPLLKTLEQK